MESVPAIEELYGRDFTRLVRSLAVAFDPESAADAVQDAFIAADRRWGKVGRYDDPGAWVRRVAINRLLNGRRDWRRRSEIIAAVRVPRDEDLTAELIDLRRAVADLPDRMRVAVCLHYLADLSIDDVAEALGVSVGTVKSNLHDARVRLRTMLKEEPHE